MQLITTRKRILKTLVPIGIWLLSITFEDPIKKVINSIFKVNVGNMDINPYILTMTVLFAVFMVGLLLYWKSSDRAKKRTAKQEYLLEEIRKAQIAARYSYEQTMNIKRHLEKKYQEPVQQINYLFMNDGELQEEMTKFNLDSMDLIKPSYFDTLKKEYFSK